MCVKHAQSWLSLDFSHGKDMDNNYEINQAVPCIKEIHSGFDKR